METKTNMIFCQSCGMPLTSEEQYGTEAGGAKSTDYCSYCYAEGAFTSETTLEQMIDLCAAPMCEANPGMSDAEAKKAMAAFLPTLKRWK